MLTRQNLGAQLRAANLGWSAAIEPVPKTGRVRFNQIGNLSNLRHTGEPGIDLSKQKYQQMIGNLTPVTQLQQQRNGAVLFGTWGLRSTRGLISRRLTLTHGQSSSFACGMGRCLAQHTMKKRMRCLCSRKRQMLTRRSHQPH